VSRRGPRQLVAAVVVGTLAMAAVGPAVATSHRPARHHSVSDHHHRSWRSGVFIDDTGVHTYRDARNFGTWRGDPVTTATDFQTAVSWKTFAQSQRIISTWGHQHHVRLSLSVPMFVGNGSLRSVASGVDDRWFTAMARNLVGAGLSHSILRIGWEFNETFQRWGVDNARGARLYVRAFRHVVRAVRAVKHQHFAFDWTVYNSRAGYRHLATAYPGDRYVDFVGTDIYDRNQRGAPETPAQRWHDIVHAPSGLQWQTRFANRHGKQLAVPEWALVSTPLFPARSGGDDPTFVRHMWRWFCHHNVGYEDYFNTISYTGAIFTINNHHVFPNATALYRRLWASRAG
jgi:hypothetical protein